MRVVFTQEKQKSSVQCEFNESTKIQKRFENTEDQKLGISLERQQQAKTHRPGRKSQAAKIGKSKIQQRRAEKNPGQKDPRQGKGEDVVVVEDAERFSLAWLLTTCSVGR